MRERDRVLQIVKLDDTFLRVVTVRPVAEAARVPGGIVPFGFTLGNPFADRLADRRGMGNADLNATGVIEVG